METKDFQLLPIGDLFGYMIMVSLLPPLRALSISEWQEVKDDPEKLCKKMSEKNPDMAADIEEAYKKAKETVEKEEQK